MFRHEQHRPAHWRIGLPAPPRVPPTSTFSVRDCFQHKVIAALGGESRPRVGLGVLTASVVFGVLRALGALSRGASATAVVGIVLFRGVSSAVFRHFYELTRDGYFVALLRALGNTWPLLVDWGNWSETALYVCSAGVLLLSLDGALGYRYWTEDTDLATTTERTGTESAPSTS